MRVQGHQLKQFLAINCLQLFLNRSDEKCTECSVNKISTKFESIEALVRIHVMCQCESLEAFWICNWIGSGGSEDPLSLSLDLDLGFNIMRKWM